MDCLVLIFSKDRALQLDATLRSFQLHCKDAYSSQISVLYTTSAPLHTGQYETLIREFGIYQNIRFVPEQDFRTDVLALLAPFDFVLFLVDDSIFVRDFRLAEATENLQQNSDALGFSLRLGRNTTYCYTLDKKQRVPEFRSLKDSVLKYGWPSAEYDYGYPLELSSSVYRTEDVLPFFARLQFKNPNTLEGAMSIHRKAFQQERPFLLCYAQSVAFSTPLNMVQTMWQNRVSQNNEYSPDRLAERFAQGQRIDIHHYTNFLPDACHQEVELKFAEPSDTKQHDTHAVIPACPESFRTSTSKTCFTNGYAAEKPLISVIIPCFNQAQYLPEAVESVVNQTYKHWECIIVNDGSPDNTSETARLLIDRYPHCSIRLLEKPNSGLADARNTGIREARGAWILPLDSDDMFAPEYMEHAVRIIKDSPSVNVVTTNEEAFGATPHAWIPNEYTPQRILAENTFIYASLYKKELWEAVGGYYPGIPWGAEDWNFWIACSRAGIVHKRIHEKLLLYRTHAGTSMRDRMKKHWSQVVAIIHTLHPDLYPAQRLISDHTIIAGAHPDTVAKIDSVISRFPDLAMPYFWRGLIHEHSGNPDLAQMNYEKSLALSSGNTWQQELCMLRVKALAHVERLKDAFSGKDHILPISKLSEFLNSPEIPEAGRSFLREADEYYTKGDLGAARNNIREALKLAPHNPVLMVAHGTVFLRQGLSEPAQKEFLRAKILNPEAAMASMGTEALVNLAECYAGNGDHNSATSLYKRVLEIFEKRKEISTISRLRIGIPIIGSKIWSGGVTYIELLIKALHSLPRHERPQLFFIITDDKLNEIDLHLHLFPMVDGSIFVGNNIHRANIIIPKAFKHISSYQDLSSEIDFYYPVPSTAWPDFCSASWIPDFQHVHLPEFFSANEVQSRAVAFQKIALFAKLVVLSSKDAEKDFRMLYPKSKAVIRILSFHNLIPDEVYTGDPIGIQHKYNLPDEFLICSNQFWAHKNHTLLFEALSEINSAGKPVHLVCTGSTTDYRFPDYFQKIQQKVVNLGISNIVHILGIIPRNEQLQLMRRALAVVQPSLFEGWSTVVEDARSLGKPMILSDLAVHYEQAPDHTVYFDRKNAKDLAEKISRFLLDLGPGPDTFKEQEARAKVGDLVKAFARKFCSIALEAQKIYAGSPNIEPVLPESQLYDTSVSRQESIKVSAIVSTYNAEKFIRGCLDDLVNQTLYRRGELEIIVVNSGSQQNEEAIVKEFQGKYPRIRYIKTDNRETVYAAWNRGIREAQGKYITNANTDDRHRADALDTMANLLDENPDIGLVYADVIVTETENQSFENHTPVDVLRQADFDREILSLGCFIGPQPMWRRTLHDRYGFFDETFIVSGDWEFWLRIAEDTKFLHIPLSLGLYFRSPFGVEHAHLDKKNREDNLIVRKFLPSYWPTFEKDLQVAAEAPNLDGDSIYKIGFLLDTLERTETAKKLFSNYLDRNPSDMQIRKALEILITRGSFIDRADKTGYEKAGQETPAESGIPPLASVVIPCYNQARYLSHAIESVVRQTFEDWECIIVNDGSPDNTSEVAKELIANYPDKKIILLEKENGGLADARNYGITHARGKYILPLDADDGIHPDMLNKTVSLLESNSELTVVYTHTVHYSERKGIENIRAFPDYDPKNLLAINCFSYCSLYQRKAWEAAGGYNTNMAAGYEDWDFWIACLEKGFLNPKCIPEPLFFYRVKENSMIKQAIKSDARLKAQLIINHASLYNPAQIHWAEGVMAKDPAILAIPHNEGVIPGFFEPLLGSPALSGSMSQESPSSGISMNSGGEDHPLVSVVIPCYKQAMFLPEALESVVKQVYQNWECIIVNDGSPDNTSEVAKELIANYPDKKIILLEKENGGLSDARNFGIKHTRGEYILPLDADDAIHPDMLMKTVEMLKSSPDIAIAYTDALYSGKENKIVRSEEYDLDKLSVHNRFNYCSLYRRKAWEAAGGYNTNMIWGYEDWDFWISCAEKGFYGRRIPEPLFLYRVKDSGMYTKAREHDDELRARIVMNHPRLYDDETKNWAENILAKKQLVQRDSSLDNLRNQQGIFASRPVEKTDPAEQIMTFINQADRHIASGDLASARESIRKALPYASGNEQLSRLLTTILDNLRDQKTAEQFLRSQESEREN